MRTFTKTQLSRQMTHDHEAFNQLSWYVASNDAASNIKEPNLAISLGIQPCSACMLSAHFTLSSHRSLGLPDKTDLNS